MFDRQQALKTASRPGIWFLLSSAYWDSGFRGLFVGSSAVFARQALLTGTQLAFYDRSKVLMQRITGCAIDSWPVMGGAACVAGAAATVAIAPVETVKTQMQANKRKKLGVMQTAKSFVRNHGVVSLWRGSFALWLKLAPHTIIVLALTDKLRKMFGIPLLL